MIHDLSETICAPATALGGGLAVIRISGSLAPQIAETLLGKRLAPRKATTAGLRIDGQLIDLVVATYFAAPHSYTGEEVVELSCHASPFIVRSILEWISQQEGCRMADPGEFTRRALAHGKLDLAEAEAVADLIAATTATQHKMAMEQHTGRLSHLLNELRATLLRFAGLLELELDFSEEDVAFADRSTLVATLATIQHQLRLLTQSFTTGQELQQGIPTAIIGAPNVGKSSLLNVLLQHERAIVSDIPGTTRDTVEGRLTIRGTLFRLIDTAGIRETADTVEAMGVRRSREAVENADLVIFVCDGSQPLDEEDQAIIDLCMEQENAVALINKTDLGSAVEPGELPFLNVIPICAKTGAGLDQLADAVDTMFENETPCDGSILTNARQFDAIRRAYEAMLRALQGLQLGVTPDAVLTDVEQAMESMGEITGATVREDITARIFERFCVGK